MCPLRNAHISAQYETKHKGNKHGLTVASETSFFMLLQILHGVEALQQFCNKSVAVIEGAFRQQAAESKGGIVSAIVLNYF